MIFQSVLLTAKRAQVQQNLLTAHSASLGFGLSLQQMCAMRAVLLTLMRTLELVLV